jgi:zinc protease
MAGQTRAKDSIERSTWAEGVNANASSEGATLSYVGAHAFGSERLNRWRLGNGLTILILKDSSAPVVAYHTWFNVGSRHERPGKTGLAHLFEHLMFGETENFAAGVFDRKLEESGAESNAATWVDWTYYHELLPADRVKLVVKLEAERMHGLVLREPQVASEKEVVANERRFRVEDDVEGLANELLYRTAFERHPYRWPTIGWMADIQDFTPEDCVAFYKTYYAPNNATIVVAGDVNERSLLLSIRDAYGAIPRHAVPPEDIAPEPLQVAGRAVELRKPSASEKLAVAFKGPALGDADHTQLTILCEVLFGGRGSRLYRRLVIERELALDVRGWVSTFRDPGLFECWVTAREGIKAEAIRPILDEAFTRVCADVVSEDEIDRAKARLELGSLQQLETVSGKAEQIGFFETVLGDPSHAFRRIEAFRRATVSDLRRVARRYLESSQQTVLRVIPERSAGPAEAAQ